MNRYDARENAFAVVFSSHFQKDVKIEEIRELYQETQSVENDPYFELLVSTVYQHIDEIDQAIESNLKHWKINRISKIALSVLRIAVAEIKYIEETPDHVAINEAIELAKKYEDQKCGGFVNGVLSAILKK